MKCNWNPENTPAELYSMLRTLAEEYPVAENPAEANIRFVKVDDLETLSVKRDGNTFVITYGRTAFAARGLAYVMADMECAEKIAFKTYGILFDCTRGNIITVKHFKHWLRRLSLMGYNMAMIYTKDEHSIDLAKIDKDAILIDWGYNENYPFLRSYSSTHTTLASLFPSLNTTSTSGISGLPIFPTQGSNPHLLYLLHYRQILYR